MGIATKHQVVVFDAADLATESSFWAGVLDGEILEDDDWHMVTIDRAPKVGVQMAPDHRPPQWPDGEPQQIHLDLWVDDIEASHAEVLRLGAKPLQEQNDDGFRVYADPAGHPFCLCWVTVQG